MEFEIVIVILIITLLLSSSISSAVAYWKRNALFGTKIGEECDTDTDKIGCKRPLKCEQSICRAPKNTACKTLDDCQSPLVCDTYSMKCQPSAVTSSSSTTTENIDFQGAWDTEWSTCASETDTCGVKGSQTKQFTVSRAASGTGTVCTNDRVKSQACDLRTCSTLPETGGERVVPENIDCQGDWDTEWSTCASDTVRCGVKGSQTKKFTVSRVASGTGTACTNDREKSQECDLPTCTHGQGLGLRLDPGSSFVPPP